jgi:hypothetical protein
MTQPHEHESYINRYLRYTANQESPDIFHVWGAITTMAHAVGRNIWVDQSYFKIYANQYVILVAGSGACKKGAALGVARGLIQDALGDRDDKLFIPGKIYKEALIRVMNKRVADPFSKDDTPVQVHRAITLYSPELGSFLDKNMQQSGMADFLTEIYDCPTDHDHITKNAGVDKLKDVWVSMIGATTPTWMQRNMTPAVFGEGFVSRTMLIYADKPKGSFPRPTITEEMKHTRAQLVADLDRFSHLRGDFTFGPGAGEFFDKWYDGRDRGGRGVSVESGFVEREPDHVLKVGMMFSLSAGTEPLIHVPHLEAAIKLVGRIKATMSHALAGAQAEAGQQSMFQVLATIQKWEDSRGATLQQLGRRLFNSLDPETIQKCIVGLRQNGQISTNQVETNGKTYIYYQATESTNGAGEG